MNRDGFQVCAAIVLLAVAGLTWFVWQRVSANPDVKVLRAYEGVQWIKFPAPTQLRIHPLGEFETAFEARVDIASIPEDAVLRFRALAYARVFVNDAMALGRSGGVDEWNHPVAIDIAPLLRVGENAVRIEVHNTNGPRLLWAACSAIGLDTNAGWRVSHEGEDWREATGASNFAPSDLSRRFMPPWRAVLYTLPLTLTVFLLSIAWQVCPAEHRVRVRIGPWLRPSRVRWYVMGAWVVLGANNILKLPMATGFDIEGHINYIHFITLHGRLPHADEGWQMFQSPLYYVVSAGPYWVLSKFFELDRVIQLLRVIPLVCGAAQVEVVYRMGRRLFAAQPDLQTAMIVFAGFLPMSLYISQYIGNEPMAGLLTALACFQCVRMLTSEVCRGREVALLGVLLGLAILTKVTAILLIPAAGCVVVYVSWRASKGALRSIGLQTGLFVAVLAIVCGWMFVRTWLQFGKPIVGGWEIARNIVWWQDPGYRTWGQFLTFGEALVRPVAAGTAGLWDGFYSTFWLDGLLSSFVEYEYRPGWNYAFVIAGAWLAVVPLGIMMAGVVRGVVRRLAHEHAVLYFGVAACGTYLAVFAYLFLTLPVYSTGKATYTLGLLPVYALFLAKGLEAVGPRWRVPANAWIAAWGASAWAGYFVIARG